VRLAGILVGGGCRRLCALGAPGGGGLWRAGGGAEPLAARSASARSRSAASSTRAPDSSP
jgi:hypothetical protein